MGAHCKGYNRNSIGICYCGGVESDGKTPKDTRNEAQKEALLCVLRTMKAMYPDAVIHSHRDFANKACPSFDATEEYKNL
jgi:N-acetylmuramoyl-L-alanine amidase